MSSLPITPRTALLTICGLTVFLYSEAFSDEPSARNLESPITSLAGKSWPATDSLNSSTDTKADANQCLMGLCWTPGNFDVVCMENNSGHGDYLLRFPSAVPSGDTINDSVCLEWYVSRSPQTEIQHAPAIVVVHESGSAMEVGRTFAKSLRHLGFHTFMIQLPYYGVRAKDRSKRREVNQISAMRQAVADVRRARDAVAAIPFVDSRIIALQGTSLGGFVSTTAASLDGKYDAVFLMLAGGDLYDIMQNGEKDAAKARERLAKQGLSGDALRRVVQAVEPIRIAHRLNAERVWLYSGIYDKVVPLKNAELLAESIGLAEKHHVKMLANHYSGVVFLPMIFAHIHEQMQIMQKQIE